MTKSKTSDLNTGLRSLAARFWFIFITIFILTLSFSNPVIPDVPGMLAQIVLPLNNWVAENIFRLREPYISSVISDSTGLYIHLFTLVVLSLGAAMTWHYINREKDFPRKLFYCWRIVITYYLAYHLLTYGCNKLFKWQFFSPEPNTLFTTVGNTHRDLLYWTTMGSSHSYNVFMGLTEIIAGILLLFKPSRLAGALLGLGIVVNIIMVNFSFNISVKVFSIFLLLLTLTILFPERKRIWAFLTGQSFNSASSGPLPATVMKTRRWLKPLVLAYVLTAVLFVYIKTGNYNDDLHPRPAFHGAYEVSAFIANGDTVPPLSTDSFRWRRVFIHRHGYLIIQQMNDEMADFIFAADTINHKWIIRDERRGEDREFAYRTINGNDLILQSLDGRPLKLHLVKIDLQSLPLLQKEFDWTIDP